MFYAASKILWFLAQPGTIILLFLLLGLLLSFSKRRMLSRMMLIVAALILILCGYTSIGYVTMRPLEEVFPRPPAPASVTGIIVLGGGMDAEINAIRFGYELNRSGDRFVEALRLARLYPEAKILISGGAGYMYPGGDTEAAAGTRFFADFGIAPTRIVQEDASRNTEENAQLTRETLNPQPGDTWLLVTSAYHMPRSVGLFRKVGFPVTPWPTDYFTAGNETFGLRFDQPAENFSVATRAMREWVGLAAYTFTGKIDTLLPRPDGSK
jgi:uncharacterized SAM-binding protein YcdF (DUF218 family)